MANSQFRAGFNIINDNQAEGWLLKEGHGVVAAWAERYFVLNTATQSLSYYDNSDKKPANKKGEYQFNSPSKCKVEARNDKSGHPHTIFALGSSQNKDDHMADLWIDAQTAEVKHKWISAIRKAIKKEPIVDSVRHEIQEKQDEIAADQAKLDALQKGPQNADTKARIAMLTEEINADTNDINQLESDSCEGMCVAMCTVM